MNAILPAVSVVIPTCNRAAFLREALLSLVDGRDATGTHEVVVVDNGCTDATAAVVEELRSAGHLVRIIREERKGASFARNTGVRAARAPVIAFMDDDQRAAPHWPQVIERVFAERPEVAFVSGPVHPLWNGGPPVWVNGRTRGALSIVARGDEEQVIDADHWMCLMGGNMAIRRGVLDAVGGWHNYSRSEDRELTVRLLLAGYRGMYVPEMVMYHHMDPARLTRRYVRWWNAVEGRMRAAYRFDELFDVTGRIRPCPDEGRRLFGVCLFVYRDLVSEFGRFMASSLLLRRELAFEHEIRVRYLWNYIRARARSSTPRATAA